MHLHKPVLLAAIIISGFLFSCQTKPDAAENQSDSSKKSADTVLTQPRLNKSTENQSDTATNQNYLVSRGKAGPITIGLPIKQLKAIIPAQQLKAVAITKEGKGYQAYEIRQRSNKKEPELVIEEICEPDCHVWRIHIKDAAYKTKEGLGIGATLGEVKKYYPISFLGPGETEIVAVSSKNKITFLLDVSKLPPAKVPFLDKANTPDSVRVSGIFLL